MAPTAEHLAEAEKVRGIVMTNMLRADTCLKICERLRDPRRIKFLRVYKTIGEFLPRIFAEDVIMALARIVDQSGHPSVASLSRLVRLASPPLMDARCTELQHIMKKHDATLAIYRDKHLAHSDLDSPGVTLHLRDFASALGDSHTAYDEAARALWPNRTWVKEYSSTDTDAEAFERLLTTWDYPPVDER